METYIINGQEYLNDYVAICLCCDATFRTEQEAFEHCNETEHDVHFCEPI